jgi:hypothetical protein
MSTDPAIRKAEFAGYPNPFINNSILKFSVEKETDYTVTLFNSIGGKVAVLEHGRALEGKQNTVILNGSRLPAGVYVVQLTTGTTVRTIKLVKK